MKLKLIALLSCCLTVTLVFFYACTDKELETDHFEVATTRAVQGQISSKYYHILPGSDEWRSLQTGQDMWDACQLSEEQLRNLSTEELIEACMEFPMAYDFIAADTERNGIAYAIKQFNGLTELAQRDDAASKMIEAYQQMDFVGETIVTRSINTSFLLSMAYTELLLVNQNFLGKMTREEQDLLKSIAEEKYMMKLEYPEYFGLRNIEHSLVICVELALISDKAFNEEELQLLRGFANYYQMWDPTDLERISQLAFE